MAMAEATSEPQGHQLGADAAQRRAAQIGRADDLGRPGTVRSQKLGGRFCPAAPSELYP